MRLTTTPQEPRAATPMEIIRNIFATHGRFSPTERKAWAISRRLFREKALSNDDIRALIAIGGEGVTPFRMVLERDGGRHGSARREAIVDALHAAPEADQHASTVIALLASFIEDPEGMVGAKAVAHLATFGPKVDGLLMKALGSGNRWTRSYAVRALGAFGTVRAVPTLIRALQDDDERVRSDAAEALGTLGDSQATQPLLSALADPNWLVRESASSALAALNDREVVEKLTRFLHDEDPHVRAQAVRTLAHLDPSVALAPLIHALDDDHFEVQWDAVDGLASAHNSAAVAPLLARYHDGDKELRHRIAAACGRIGYQHVIAHLTHDARTIRLAAAEMIGQLRDMQWLPELTARWRHETDPEVQMWLIIAIAEMTATAGKASPNPAVEALIAAADSPHRPVRYHATRALEGLRHPLAEQFIQQRIHPTCVRITCPNCLQPLRLHPPLTGKRWRCHHCNLGFTIQQQKGAQLTVVPETSRTSPPIQPEGDEPWHTVLGVPPDADAATIQRAFRGLLKQYHPDKVAGLGAEFQRLAEAKTRQLTQALRAGLAHCERG